MTKEEYEALPRYERKSIGIYNEMKSNDDLNPPKVINYFCARGKNEPEVTGKEQQLFPTNYNKVVDLGLVKGKIVDKLFTKKITKLSNGRKARQTLRKDCEELSPWDSYTLSSICNYVSQAHYEGCNKVVLSVKELKFLGMY